MEWWMYVIIFGGIIAVYFIGCLIIYFLTKNAQKKVDSYINNVIGKEKERFDIILNLKNQMEEDGRFLPKNMVETTMQVEEEFKKIPVDISKIKGSDDFLIIYYRKYLKEKKLLTKYGEKDKLLESITYMDPNDKLSPYYNYNKAAIKYNSYLGMGFMNPFGRNSIKAPIL